MNKIYLLGYFDLKVCKCFLAVVFFSSPFFVWASLPTTTTATTQKYPLLSLITKAAWSAAERSSGLTSNPRVPGSNPGAGGIRMMASCKSLVECWVSQLRAFGPFRGACLSAQNWSCARDWGSSWISLHTPAAAALAGSTDEQSLL